MSEPLEVDLYTEGQDDLQEFNKGGILKELREKDFSNSKPVNRGT